MEGQIGCWVDNGAHVLHLGGSCWPCDRDVEAVQVWRGQALLLSSDTDCLSLWDREGLVRTARVGVYPQDMAVQGELACVCGGADGRLHLLSLPELLPLADFTLPGMPERVCLQGDVAHVLALLTDPEVQTLLLTVGLAAGEYREIGRFPGLPGAITADDTGLWIGVSELVLHLPKGCDAPDMVVEGIGLARRIETETEGITVTDALNGREYHLRIKKERPSCDERPCV